MAKTTRIVFRPGEVDGLVSTAIIMHGGIYNFSPQGSFVDFTPTQFYKFLDFLNAALHDDMFEDKEKNQIKDTIKHVLSQLPEA